MAAAIFPLLVFTLAGMKIVTGRNLDTMQGTWLLPADVAEACVPRTGDDSSSDESSSSSSSSADGMESDGMDGMEKPGLTSGMRAAEIPLRPERRTCPDLVARIALI